MNIPVRERTLKQITKSLNDMETTGQVDLSILDNLNELRQFLQSIKTKWLQNKNSDGFYFYQAVRNIDLILDKMTERFKKSKENRDNPKIALDSLVLLPAIDQVLKITESDVINDQTIDFVLRTTRDLRNVATHQNLIEPQEVDIALIDKEQLKWEFENIMKNIDMPTHPPFKVVKDDKETESCT